MNAAPFATDEFEGWIGFDEIRSRRQLPPTTGGAYIVVRDSTDPPVYLATSTGGFFRGKDPTVDPTVLARNWVPESQILYIGKSNKLRRRLFEYAAFGEGRPVGHWGGRYIWQLDDSRELDVAWVTCKDGETHSELEARLVGQVKRLTGRLPFANITDPS